MIERERRFISLQLPDLNYDEMKHIEQIYGDIDIMYKKALFNNHELLIHNEDIASLKGRGRIRHMGNQYTLDIKYGNGYEREEYSFSITNTSIASSLIETDKNRIIKDRHIARSERYDTMIDIFKDRYNGIIIGELEGECLNINIPQWACIEITDNNELSNMNLYFSDTAYIMNYYRRMLDDCQDKQT